MKLRILCVSMLAAGLATGCSPDRNEEVEQRDTTIQTDERTVVDDKRYAEQGDIQTRHDNHALTIEMNKVNEEGIAGTIGTITARETADGVVFTSNLRGLEAGEHGFHIHQYPDCGPGIKSGERKPAGAAGGHLDPTDTNTHEGPHGEGHLGDLPVIRVGNDGNYAQEITAPRLKLSDLKNRALVVHQKGDNYEKDPAGGSGKPVACGVVK